MILSISRLSLILLAMSLLISCEKKEEKALPAAENFYEFTTYRVPAEWEPAKGVMFACPPVIPKALIIELSKDTHIYPVVENDSSEAEARKWFTSWGIDMNKVTFIKLPFDDDVFWLRDWGPSAVFNNKEEMKLADVTFKNSDPYSDLACNDSLELQQNEDGSTYYSEISDHNIDSLAKQLGFETHQVPITLTGGNMLTDGAGTAISTCILTTENRYNGVSDNEFFQRADSLLGITNYQIIPNFEKDGIQHIDCLLKLVDERTLLVAEPPEDHPSHPIIEEIVNDTLKNLKNSYGQPYTIRRIKTEPFLTDDGVEYLTAYSNSLILNKNVYVPLYGLESDSLALDTWRSVLPGYTVKGFPFFLDQEAYLSEFPFDRYREWGVNHGWSYEDAIHCRTRAVWDEQMIFLSVNAPAVETSSGLPIVYASAKDYGGEQETLSLTLQWRTSGESTWNQKEMQPWQGNNHWYSELPLKPESSGIEFYIEAHTGKGKSLTRPVTAPKGFYTYETPMLRAGLE
ncbi:agmatine deiminase family protein [Robertkochia aurantiaca]|uniref:agmatine deiminase family protein n=1 Tax=Robertkochia aurantiaca TaxID=2873700 RepID=UPI001CCA1C0F|nr:agmatine deiminase family protein [Robertkochia sp. 3YJGBD-33]